MNIEASFLFRRLQSIRYDIGKQLAQLGRKARKFSRELVSSFQFDLIRAHSRGEYFEDVFQDFGDFSRHRGC